MCGGTRRLTTSTLRAYGFVCKVLEREREDYEIAVNDLGAKILRSGLCGALAAVQRPGEGGELLFRHLTDVRVPGLEGATANDLARRLGEQLDADADMLATREMLQVSMWLKRAVRARFGEG
jgi:CRISPR-associated protein Cmr5